MIKSKEVLVDREIGQATITVTLYSRNVKEYPTKLGLAEIKEIGELGGAEVLEIISGNPISNRYGEVTGSWVVKIPSKHPEGSTMDVLNKRKRTRKSKKAKTEKTGE
tara:strand:- start:277 stop:597 length:321 start_codon:yes stop_codon:yes gene_type:complete